jgi:hypothetical protein
MAAKKWQMVRLSAETHALLAAEVETQKRRQIEQDSDLEVSERWGITADTVIAYALRLLVARRVRRQKARAKRSLARGPRGRLATDSPAPTPGPG